MNKPELIKKVSEVAGTSQKATKPVVDALFTVIADAMAAGEEVSVTGFGTFLNAQRDAHTGRNPKTGESVEVPAHGSPRFKASVTLRQKCY